MSLISRGALGNAWVAGLASDLDFHSNQLVDFQTMGNVGSVLGQLPFAYLFPLFPMNWQVPGMELGWAVFTLLQYRANTYSAFMAYRFLVGFFEASFFPGVHYVLGSWCKYIPSLSIFPILSSTCPPPSLSLSLFLCL